MHAKLDVWQTAYDFHENVRNSIGVVRTMRFNIKSDYSNDSDSTHRRRCTDHSVVFARWSQCDTWLSQRKYPPDGISISSSVFLGLTGLPDRHTDHAT